MQGGMANGFRRGWRGWMPMQKSSEAARDCGDEKTWVDARRRHVGA